MPDDITIPTKADLLYPVLEAVRRLGGTAPIAEINEAVVIGERFTNEQLTVRSSSGISKIIDRLGWARTDLKAAGLLNNDGRGTWRLTETGRRATAAEVGDLVARARGLQVPAGAPAPEDTAVAAVEYRAVDRESLRERIGLLHEQVRERLLQQVLAAPPKGLEQIILDLLAAMGYTDRGGRTELIGGSGDGGVDGVVYEDPLNLHRIYCQAKRYAIGHKVGPSDIREFIGALDIKRHSEGVFVTTSDFTEQAKTESNGSSKHIRLIDGTELALLMFEHGIGTRTHTFEFKELNPDYFA